MTASPSPSLLSTLRLIRSEGVGPVTYRRLVERFGDAETVIKAIPNFKKPIHLPETEPLIQEILVLEKSGGAWIDLEHPAYPSLLHPLEDAPPVLATKGNLALLARPMIGIVGARNASTNGRRLAQKLAHDLGKAGFVIVSGLARGIDTAAHEAALETGTIAVLASGVDVVYPPENKKLYDAIAQRGLILSENPMGVDPAAPLFPRRNRIISGLCCGVIVVEAAMKSGSLITAHYALDQGREVFAIPGSPLDPRANGPNHLIKSGQAHLVETAEDVIELLNGLRGLDMNSELVRHALDRVAELDAPAPVPKKKTPRPSADDLPLLAQQLDFETEPASAVPVYTRSLTNDQARIILLEHLGPSPCDIDHLAHATQIPASTLLGLLVELELMGQIQRLAGNQVVRI